MFSNPSVPLFNFSNYTYWTITHGPKTSINDPDQSPTISYRSPMQDHLTFRNPKDRARFKSKIKYPKNRKQDCWEWLGTIGKDGYGKLVLNGKNCRAHRVAYHNFVNQLLSSEELVCHTCDNPKCVNPFHLWKGSHKDNLNDMAKKGRASNTKKTHCLRGHEYTEENTRLRFRRGYKDRDCKDCAKIRRSDKLSYNKNQKEYYQKRKQRNLLSLACSH
jgi:hypothetical protein